MAKYTGSVQDAYQTAYNSGLRGQKLIDDLNATGQFPYAQAGQYYPDSGMIGFPDFYTLADGSIVPRAKNNGVYGGMQDKSKALANTWMGPTTAEPVVPDAITPPAGVSPTTPSPAASLANSLGDWTVADNAPAITKSTGQLYDPNHPATGPQSESPITHRFNTPRLTTAGPQSGGRFAVKYLTGNPVLDALGNLQGRGL